MNKYCEMVERLLHLYLYFNFNLRYTVVCAIHTRDKNKSIDQVQEKQMSATQDF